jgi:hypothetical protein
MGSRELDDGGRVPGGGGRAWRAVGRRPGGYGGHGEGFSRGVAEVLGCLVGGLWRSGEFERAGGITPWDVLFVEFRGGGWRAVGALVGSSDVLSSIAGVERAAHFFQELAALAFPDVDECDCGDY